MTTHILCTSNNLNNEFFLNAVIRLIEELNICMETVGSLGEKSHLDKEIALYKKLIFRVLNTLANIEFPKNITDIQYTYLISSIRSAYSIFGKLRNSEYALARLLALTLKAYADDINEYLVSQKNEEKTITLKDACINAHYIKLACLAL